MSKGRSAQTGTEPLIDIIVGISDGLVVPFAFATAISRITTDNVVVIGWVLTAIIVGAIAMGLGSYYAAKEQDHDDAKEQDVYAQLELDAEVVNAISEETKQNKSHWQELTKQYGVDASFDAVGAKTSAFNIAIAYACGGLIPLTPYFFSSNPTTGFRLSAGITVGCLLIFGLVKAKYTSQNPATTAFRYILTGITAATAAYFVAGLFA